MALTQSLATLSPPQLDRWMATARQKAASGRVNQRIPRLAAADPASFAVQIRDGTGVLYANGELEQPFPLMSVVKPFLLLYLLEKLGSQQVWRWVGQSPSQAPFNSLDQLRADGGFPRNPMLNSGAMVLAGQVPGKDGVEATENLRLWLNQQAGCGLWLDHDLLASVRQGNRDANLALLQCLHEAGHVMDSERALDVYERVCCLTGRVADLAQLSMVLAVGSVVESKAAKRPPEIPQQGSEQVPVQPQHRRVVNEVMLTCGLYEASGEYQARIGLPMKSGISGALVTVVPGEGAIATYSPALDATSNPIAGLAFVEQLCQGSLTASRSGLG